MSAFDPEFEYNFRYLAEARKSLYKEEIDQAKIVLFVGIIAVVLSLVGAYAMVSFLSEHRAKQVSIRKVMGATVSEVLHLSVREIIWMILVAFIIATPLAYIIGNKWLQNFAQKISINPLPFILALIILAALVFITVFFRERRSAMVNPIDNLRQE
jgi:putative ABC transport system permease protein